LENDKVNHCSFTETATATTATTTTTTTTTITITIDLPGTLRRIYMVGLTLERDALAGLGVYPSVVRACARARCKISFMFSYLFIS